MLKGNGASSSTDQTRPMTNETGEDDYSIPALVEWLRAKYRRHGEIEDQLAADALERLSRHATLKTP